MVKFSRIAIAFSALILAALSACATPAQAQDATPSATPTPIYKGYSVIINHEGTQYAPLSVVTSAVETVPAAPRLELSIIPEGSCTIRCLPGGCDPISDPAPWEEPTTTQGYLVSGPVGMTIGPDRQGVCGMSSRWDCAATSSACAVDTYERQ
ncbi:MAG: hypothetical protein WA005_03225 [Candidatus Binataceae bacterium]